MSAHGSDGTKLTSLAPGTRAIVRQVLEQQGRRERLAALGVTPGVPVEILQRYPTVVFRCDETELAVEREVAEAILVDVVTS